MNANEPIPVIPLEYEPATRKPSRWLDVLRWLIPFTWLTCAIAWLLIVLADVETVVATGPAICSAGVIMMYGALRCRWPAATVLGAAHVAICVLFFALVNLLNWSPGQATQPFAITGGIYTFLTLVPSLVLWLRPRREV